MEIFCVQSLESKTAVSVVLVGTSLDNIRVKKKLKLFTVVDVHIIIYKTTQF